MNRKFLVTLAFVGLGVFYFAFIGSVLAQTTASSTSAPVFSNIRVENNMYSGGSSGAQVRWTTDIASDSTVYYGITSGAYNLTSAARCDSGGYVTDHCVNLTYLTPGAAYYYRPQSQTSGGAVSWQGGNQFTAASSGGGGGSSSGSGTPAPPSSVSAYQYSGYISVNWATVSDATHYSLYKSTNSGAYTWLATSDGTNSSNYSDNSITSGSAYQYKVEACRSGYGCSTTGTESSVITYTPPDTSAPSAPTGFAATAVSASQINLSWTASTDDTAVTGYKIYRNGTFYYQIYSSGTLSYSDTGLSSNTQYSYTVKAYDAAGNESPQSTSVSATTMGGTASCTGLTLTFSGGKTSYTVGETVNYTYTCSPGGTASYVEVQLVKPDGSVTTYNTVSGSVSTNSLGFGTSNLFAGNYTLRACFASGCSTVTASATFSIGSNSSVPITPSGLSAALVGSNAVNLSWSGTTNNITSFRVYSRLSGNSWSASYESRGLESLLSSSNNAVAVQISPSSSSGTYEYKIQACNSVGCSGDSNIAQIPIWLSHTWRFKDNLTAVSYVFNRSDGDYLNYITSVDSSCLLINLSQFSWKGSAGDSSASNWQNFGIPNCSTTTTTTATATTTTTTTTTTSGSGGGSSGSSNVPAAPTGLMLAGTPMPSSVSLRWTDNSYNEDKFNIDRKITTSNVYYSSLTQLTGSNFTTYTDNTASAGITYDYRIQACQSGYGCSDYVYLTGVNVPLTSNSYATSTYSTASTTGVVATTTTYSSSLVNSNWVRHVWTFKDFATQSSYILNRTDSVYLNYISSVEASCRQIYKSRFFWKPNAGVDSAANWQNFGIPDCSGSSMTSGQYGAISTSTSVYIAPTATNTYYTTATTSTYYSGTTTSYTSTVVATPVIKSGPGTLLIEVRDQNDSPVADASITLWGGGLPSNYYSTTTVVGLYTATLPGGEYSINVAPPAGRMGLFGAMKDKISVTSDSSTRVKIVLNRGTKNIIGTIAFSSGTPVTDAEVGAYSSVSGNWISGSVDQNGLFYLSVTGGTWQVGARPKAGSAAGGWSAGTMSSVVTFANNDEQETRNVQFTVPSVDSTLKVTAVDEKGTPLSGAVVMVDVLSASDTSNTKSKYNVNAVTGSSGTASFSVGSDRYYVRGYYSGSTYANPEEMNVTVAPAKSYDIKLTFKKVSAITSDTLSLYGRTILEDGTPSNAAMVWAWSEQGESRNVTSGSDGIFNMNLTRDNKWHVGAGKESGGMQYKSSEVVIQSAEATTTQNLTLVKLKGGKMAEKVQVTESTGNKVVAESKGGARVTIPEGAVSSAGDSMTIEVKPTVEAPSQPGAQVIGSAYDVTVRSEAGSEITSLSKDIEIVLPYDEDDLIAKGASVDTIKPGYFDEKAGAWVTIDNYTIDKEKKVIVAKVSHLTRFAIVSAADITPPSAPTLVKASLAPSGAVLIAWVNPAADFDHARVFRSTKDKELGEIAASEAAGNSFADGDTKAGIMYFYTVHSIDPAGNESNNTDQVAAIGTGRGAVKKIVKEAQAQTVAVSADKFPRNLKIGMKGSDVSRLQKILTAENVYGGQVTGSFGPLTQKAVAAFQEKYPDEMLKPAGLKKGTGFVGSLTRKKLNQMSAGN